MRKAVRGPGWQGAGSRNPESQKGGPWRKKAEDRAMRKRANSQQTTKAEQGQRGGLEKVMVA